MENPWDQIASYRHQYLLDKKDIVYEHILLPTIIEVLQNQKDIDKSHIIDIGCGTGVLTREISNYVKSIIGIDPSNESIILAKEHNKNAPNIQIECIGIEEYARRYTEVFDFAIAHMTLHAIENLELAITSIAKVLKSGCGFLFSIPHPYYWAKIYEENFVDNYSYDKKSTHTNNFMGAQTPHYHRPKEYYESTLIETGFIIEDTFEPFSPKGLMEKHGKREWEFPGFLFYLCRKKIEG